MLVHLKLKSKSSFTPPCVVLIPFDLLYFSDYKKKKKKKPAHAYTYNGSVSDQHQDFTKDAKVSENNPIKCSKCSGGIW